MKLNQVGYSEPDREPTPIETVHRALDHARDLAARVEDVVNQLIGSVPAMVASGGRKSSLIQTASYRSWRQLPGAASAISLMPGLPLNGWLRCCSTMYDGA